MKLALIQVSSPDTEDPESRRKRVEEMVYAAKGADLIVLPELWAVGYFSFHSYQSHSETLSGESVSDAKRWAQDLGAFVHLGSFVESAGSGLYRNTACLISPEGHMVQRYSKVHVFGYQSLETKLIDPGGFISVSPTPYGAISSTTCYDLRFPELWRKLVDAGAEIVVVPAAWPASRVDHWNLFTSVRAVENQVFVIACNASGIQGSVLLGGHSKVIDPWGTVVAQAETEETVLFCNIDPEVPRRIRSEFPVLKDRLGSYEGIRQLKPEEIEP